MMARGMCVWLGLMCLAAVSAAEPVTRSYRDLDGDGMPEVVLENAYLRVSLTTGQPAVPEVERRNARGRRIGMKYGTRFCWGGWIWDYEYKPTGRAWCVHIDDEAENWHGIPDCFETPVRMRELTPGRYELMVPGMGLATGNGFGSRGSFRDVVYAPWTVREERLVDGGWQPVASPPEVSGLRPSEAAPGSDEPQSASAWRVHFRQVITTSLGYGCDYTKTVTLRAGSSRLEVERAVTNTGSHPWGTVFFTHGFWGQGEGGLHDEFCWSTVPLRPPSGAPGQALPEDLTDAEPAPVRQIAPAYYWGPITGEELAGNWHALGNSQTGEVLVNAIGRKVAFFRNWTDMRTYSIEPFLEIDVAPGETYRWLDTRACGQGLQGVKAQGDGAMLDWTVAKTDGGQAEMRLTVLPYQAASGRVRVTGQLAAAGTVVPVDAASEEGAYASDRVAQMTVTLPQSLVEAQAKMSLAVTLEPSGGGAAVPLASVSGTYALRERPRPRLTRQAHGAQAVVFADIKRSKATGELQPSGLCRLWEALLREAGFEVRFAPWNAKQVDVDWRGLALAVVAHDRLSVATMRRLEAFAARGGGVLFQGPVDYRRYWDDGCRLPPVAALHGEVNLRATTPRDGSREFTRANRNRFHLSADVPESPILEGLPLYPESYQGIGQFQLVTPEAGAEVVASLVPGPDVPGAPGRHPAIITARRGKGRVALMTASLQWGAPAHCILWGRLGEYHARLIGQLALWTAGCEATLPPETPEAARNASWLRRHEANVAAVGEGGQDALLVGDGLFDEWEGRGGWPWRRLTWRRRVLNWGIPGDGAAEVRWRVTHGGLAGKGIRAAVVHLAAHEGESPEAARDGALSVLSALRQALPAARLAVLAPQGAEELRGRLVEASTVDGGFTVLAPAEGQTPLEAVREFVRQP